MSKLYKKIALIIPSYNPNHHLVKLVEKLSFYSWNTIVVVNDGSEEKSLKHFNALKKIKNVHLINHPNNLGKGSAIKTGVKYILDQSCNIDGLITLDSDGQHCIEDIKNIALSSLKNKNNVIFGVRSFDKSVPLRSRFGNKITKYLLYIFNGISINDSQTGLRFLPTSILSELIKLPGKRYEFELECLFAIKRLGYEIIQLKINTIYINDNNDSHFRPLIDSAKIYAVFARFSISSILSFGIDISIFSISLYFFESIFLCTLIARVVSGIFNFQINRKLVFHSDKSNHLKKESFAYFILWLILLVLSGLIVSIEQGSSALIVIPFKILIDLLLFVAAFYTQKNIIFINK
jgi:glycosyltransferase involved in cell wall biosynthesis